jgi:hypothetical protein
MFVDFESKWFQCYCEAVLESEPGVARVYAQNALACIDERLRAFDVSAEEREAMDMAVRYLDKIRDLELRHVA